MIVDDITLMDRIGKGSFGEVYITKRKGSNLILATKKVSKSLVLQDKIKRYFNNEIFILKNVSHPNIIMLHEIKQTINNFYLVFDYCNGGTISNCLELFKKKHDKPFTEEIAQYLLKKIVNGLYYLHKNKIIHRDLKLDNVLIQFQDEIDRKSLNIFKSEIKIIDFGFARYLNDDDLAKSLLGSPINMDPQILQKLKVIDNKENFGYDDKADIWSLGTIAYEILIGVPPFDATSYDELLRKINKGEYTIPNSLKLSKQSISFLNGLLQDDPKKRLSIDEIIYHEFLTLDVTKFNPIDLNNMNKDITLSIKDNKNGVWSLFDSPGNEDISKIPSQLYSMSPYVEKLNVNVLKKDQQEDYIGSLMQNMGDLKIDDKKNSDKGNVQNKGNQRISSEDNKRIDLHHKNSSGDRRPETGRINSNSNQPKKPGFNQNIVININEFDGINNQSIQDLFDKFNMDSYLLEPMMIPNYPLSNDIIKDIDI